MTDKIIYKEDGYAIQGAIFTVYREMRAGFLEQFRLANFRCCEQLKIVAC